MHQMQSQKQIGFTLIEIAIVLVIIGLLLGGVLKGQELITSARVRNIITQQDGIKAAFYGFQDRYRAMPGDYAQATTNITGAGGIGNGNGQIESAGTVVTGSVPQEDILVWDHLSHAGFLTGSFVFGTVPSPATSPTNPYNVVLQLIHDNVYFDAAAPIPSRLNLKTGNQVPVEILAEIDRKIDDGNAQRGVFRFSAYVPPLGTAPPVTCYNSTTFNWAPTVTQSNCGAASLF